MRWQRGLQRLGSQPSSTRRTCSEPLEERVVMACYLYLYALSDRLSDHSDSDHSGSECQAVANATTSDGCGAAFAHLVLGYIAT